MACFCSIHQAIARLQAVSAWQLQPEHICMGPLRPPLERKLQAFAHIKRPEMSIPSAVRCGFLVFATTGQDTATSTLVLQEVDFVWKGHGSQVLITGDFLGWDNKVSLVKGADGAFHYKQKLSPGTYMYKYIIDGEWAHSPESPTIEDGQGGYNNQIIVTDDPPTSTNLPNKESAAKEAASAKDVTEAMPNAAAAPQTAAPETASVKEVTEATPKAAAAPKTAAPETASAKDVTQTTPKDATQATPKVAAAPKAAAPAARPAKKAEKPYPQVIIEDVIPKIKSNLQKEDGIFDIELAFQDNQLEGSFKKNGIIYTFWAFFPDGKLEGARGFSFSSHGAPPSTVEPFLIDEKKITADLLIFWILKRLAAQRIVSENIAIKF